MFGRRRVLLGSSESALDIADNYFFSDVREPSGTTLVGSKASDINTIVGSVVPFSQSNDVSRATLSSNILQFRKASNIYYDYSGNLEDWTFMHDGTSWTVSLCLENLVSSGSGSIIETNTLTWGNTGVYFLLSSTGALEMLISRGVSGQPIVYTTTPANFLTPSTKENIVITFDASASVGTTAIRFYKSGVLFHSANLLRNSFDTGNAQIRPRLGGSIAGSAFSLNADLQGFTAYKRVLTSDEISLLDTYFS